MIRKVILDNIMTKFVENLRETEQKIKSKMSPRTTMRGLFWLGTISISSFGSKSRSCETKIPHRSAE